MKNPPIEANGETLDFLSLIVSGLISLSNPHTVFFDSSTHGYNTAEVNRLAMICAMKVVGTILRETAQLRTLKRFVVPRDSNSPLPFWNLLSQAFYRLNSTRMFSSGFKLAGARCSTARSTNR